MKPALRKLTIIFGCVFFLLKLNAQTFQVHGKIIDSLSQEAVAGATISAGNQRVSSDGDGNFTINAATGLNITVSFIGYNMKTVPVNDESFLNIVLSTASQQLTDVVVTALGVKKEIKRIGYAIQEVKGEDITKARDPNPFTGLTGKVAGLSVGPSAELHLQQGVPPAQWWT